MLAVIGYNGRTIEVGPRRQQPPGPVPQEDVAPVNDQFTTTLPPIYYVTGRESVPPLDCRGDMCSACNGSGEGMRDGTVCSACGGTGEVGPWPLWSDDPCDLDAGDLDDYLVGSYAAAVAR